MERLSILVLAAVVGCSARAPSKLAPIVVSAKYSRAPAPCIQIDEHHRGRPIADTFEVVNVISGALPAKTVIWVRPFSGPQAYPEDLQIDRTYTVRVLPSESTRKRISEFRRKDGYQLLWVGADEIAVE